MLVNHHYPVLSIMFSGRRSLAHRMKASIELFTWIYATISVPVIWILFRPSGALRRFCLVIGRASPYLIVSKTYGLYYIH
jgi:hypothetical protein